MLLGKRGSAVRGVANYYFGIKKISKLAQTNQSLKYSQTMLKE